jgi:predicted ATP-dependent protease
MGENGPFPSESVINCGLFESVSDMVIAAHTAGMARVILPSKNYNEAMKCINDEHIQNLAIIPVSHVEQALENAFSPPISIDSDNTAYMSSKL